MKALSIRQPWAWLIVTGNKDVENRTWPTNFRGRNYVHAGKQPDSGWLLHAVPGAESIDIPDSLPLGAIIGEVDIAECVTHSSSPWFAGPDFSP